METKVLKMLAELCEDDVVMEDENVDLFETGLLDSLVFAELLFEVENRFGVVIAPSEVEQKDMDTPKKIMDLIRERMKG